MKFLIVEDDNDLREALVTILKEDGYDIDEAAAGDEGFYLAKQDIYDLVLLDVMLPEMNGIEIIQALRSSGNSVPVLLLTARDSVEDKVIGLDAGADDYLVKPFAIPELQARIKALLRRKGNFGQEGELCWCSVKLDSKMRDGVVGHQPLGLTAKEYELLEFLVINRGQIVSKEQILDRVWGFESDTTLGIVDVYMHYLRKKLAAIGLDTLVQTVRGAGFMLKEG